MSDRALRIAMLTHSVNARGGVVHALELAEALRSQGHHVMLLAPALAGQGLFRATGCRVELARVRSTAPVAPSDLAARVEARIDACVQRLTQLLADEHFDVLHAQDSITGNALATLRERGLIDGFVRTVHHLDLFDDVRLAARQERAFMRATQVLCVSELWRDRLRREHGIDASRVRNGVDLRRYRPLARPGPGDVGFDVVCSVPACDADVAERLGLRPGAPMILSVGGIEERKNTLRLLAAFVQLRATHPEAQLVIAGGASLLDHDACARAFAAAAAASGLRCAPGGALVVTGPVADADMPALYRLADAVAMPSLREGFGLAVLEALASGTPTVASQIAPFTEHLSDRDVCWADPLDVSSIAAALRRAVAMPAFDPPAVCHRFDWNASARTHVALYRAPPTRARRNDLACQA